MRILHVTDTFAPTVGGIEALVAGLAGAQVRTGHDVEVLTRTPQPGRDPLAAFGISREPASLSDLVERADVVHAHVSAYSPLALRAAVLAAATGVPVVASVHSVWGRAWPLIAGWTWLEGSAGLPIQWAGVSTLAAEFVTKAVRPQAPVLVVPNAIETGAWTQRDTAGPVEPVEPVTVVSTMRMATRKRPVPLLAMLRAVRESIPSDVPLRAVLIGDGPLLPRVRRYVARHGMDWVELPGTLTPERIREIYATADVYVAPGVMESFGLAALEARTAGLPVVAMSRSGVADLLTDGLDSRLVPDDVAMTAALRDLVMDRERLNTMARHCHAVTPDADWHEAVSAVFGAYASAWTLASTTAGHTSSMSSQRRSSPLSPPRFADGEPAPGVAAR